MLFGTAIARKNKQKTKKAVESQIIISNLFSFTDVQKVLFQSHLTVKVKL